MQSQSAIPLSAPADPDALVALALALDARDPYTGGHSTRVCTYAVMLAYRLKLPQAMVECIRMAALVHDVGKIGVRDSILRKPGKLWPDEQTEMERHPVIGAEIVQRLLPELAGLVRHHHERWDGLGYPDKLSGSNIPLGARILAVADSFDAMTSDRPYRKGMPVAEAMERLKAGKGTQWQPAIVNAFARLACRR